MVNEILVVVGSSKSQETTYTRLLNSDAKIVVDKYEMRSPLIGALTGFENAHSEYSLLLPCDTPFISSEIISLLLELCVHKDAAIPLWPNCHMEPLQAAYRTKSALVAASKALENKMMDMRSMITYLKKVHYVSTLSLRKTDPSLITFFNINSPEDMRRAEDLIQKSAL